MPVLDQNLHSPPPTRSIVLVAAVAVVASLSCLSNEFVWNSDELIFQPETRTLGSTLELFSLSAWAEYRRDSGENYHPVAALTYWADRAAWGAESWGCHLTNLAMHAAVCALVAAVAWRLSGSAVVSVLAGLVFAVHPAHADTVNWLKNRSQLTAVLLAMAAIALALRPGRGLLARAALSAGVLVSFAAGLLAQEQAVGAGVIIAYLCVRRGSDGRHRLGLGLSALALAAAYVYMRFTVFQFQDKVGIPLDYRPEDTGVLPVSATLAFYAAKMFFPFSHSVDYSSGLITSGEVFRWPWVPLAVVAAAGLGGWAGRWLSLTAGVWFFAAIAPASNVVPILGRPLAEQRLYFASAAGCLLVAAACGRRGRGRRSVQVLAVLMLVAMSALTATRSLVWQQANTLWRHGVRAAPQNERPRFNLALAYGETGRRGMAKHELRQALRVEPSPATHISMAYMARGDGDYATAEKHLLTALRMHDDATTRLYLALVYSDLQRCQDALRHLEAALKLRPRFHKAKISEGDVRAKLGQTGRAIQCYLDAAAIKPDSALPYLCIGDLERGQKHYRRAITYYQKARELQPDHVPTLFNEAGTYRVLQSQAQSKGNRAEAALYGQTAYRLYGRLLAAEPQHIQALVNLAHLLEERGDRQQAGHYYLEALAVDPFCEPARQGLDRLRGPR